jgi:hypothetical protein
MGMGINRPWKNIFSFGIDDLIGRIVQIDAYRFNLIAIGKYIGQVATRRIYDGSALK